MSCRERKRLDIYQGERSGKEDDRNSVSQSQANQEEATGRTEFVPMHVLLPGYIDRAQSISHPP